VILQGAHREYRFDHFGLNARCRVEEVTGRPYVDVLRELAGRTRPRKETALAFLSALLIDPPELTPVSLDPILKDLGGMPMVRQAAQAVWKTLPATMKRQRRLGGSRGR
jgi:hypothetical protein